MSDQIKHECGIALVRLKKDLGFYHKKYGTALYGLNKMQLLMQKQHNRGQDGVGVATVKLDPEVGSRFISRKRSNGNQPLRDLFEQIHGKYFNELEKEDFDNPQWLKENVPYTGELLLGHLRYGTHGGQDIEYCHPMFRRNNWITRNLLLAGNFNLTNVDELFGELISLGQHPKEQSDTVTVLEKIGHFLDVEVQRLFDQYKSKGYSNEEITELTAKNLDIQRILRKAAKDFDGGYAIGGLLGHGDAFVMRDPAGIRPAFYYEDEEVVVVASERPAIQTAFNVHFSKIKEIQPAHALIIKRDGTVTEEQFIKPLEKRPCAFERIYFSRGTDRNIYIERKKLGAQLVDKVLEEIDYDFDNTVFASVPNTADTCFLGMVQGLERALNKIKAKQIIDLGSSPKPADIEAIINKRPRVEKIVVKDVKLRTFIADGPTRDDLVSHVYDVTYGMVQDNVDTLVLVDDSIVRGTTLRQSILNMVARLRPKRLIIVSSAPQIRYPDCYGIDMSKMQNFVAFNALVALLKENGKEALLQEVYEKCKAQMHLPKEQIKNEVQALYNEFHYEVISAKIAEIITPSHIKQEVKVIYQTIEGLSEACAGNDGNWYFSGNYPTAGGNKVANRAFMNYMEGKNVRAY